MAGFPCEEIFMSAFPPSVGANRPPTLVVPFAQARGWGQISLWHRLTDSEHRQETAQLKERMLIRRKAISAKLSAIPSILGLFVLLSVVVTVGLAVVSVGCLVRGIRRKPREEDTPLDWYRITGPPLDLDSGPNESAVPVGLSTLQRHIQA